MTSCNIKLFVCLIEKSRYVESSVTMQINAQGWSLSIPWQRKWTNHFQETSNPQLAKTRPPPAFQCHIIHKPPLLCLPFFPASRYHYLRRLGVHHQRHHPKCSPENIHWKLFNENNKRTKTERLGQAGAGKRRGNGLGTHKSRPPVHGGGGKRDKKERGGSGEGRRWAVLSVVIFTGSKGQCQKLRR